MTLPRVAAAAGVCATSFVLAVVFVPVWAFVPICVAAVELPLKPPIPPAAPPVIPVCAPAVIPMCAPAFVFGPVLVLLRVFIAICGALVELPIKTLCPAGARIVAPV